MLCFLAITALATIWTCTVKADPIEKTLLTFLANLKEENKVDALLTYTDKAHGLQFEKAAKSNKNVVDLLLIRKICVPRGGTQIKICGNQMGIQIDGGGHVFSNLNTISLEIYNDNEGQQQKRFILHFQSDEKDPFKLYVPVFEVPPKYYKDYATTMKFVEDNLLEDHGPFDKPKLNHIAENQSLTLYFGWLERLLSYGIYRSQTSISNEFSAWTRPLVLQPEVIAEFINIWKNFKGN